jgi:molybdopterin-biosynthesis enzyme MoeA-like protein
MSLAPQPAALARAAIGAYVIGDEILVGKRLDKHFTFLIGALARRGLRLSWCAYLGDEPARLTEAFRRSFASGDIVFSFGGIGATPDDLTRECAAEALGLPLALQPEAEQEIRARFGGELTPQRLKMGEFPRGSEIIPNPVNRIAGFSISRHHFVPGFPQMAAPMVEWVLDNRYAALAGRDSWVEASIRVFEAGEGNLMPIMEQISADYTAAKLFSLPSMGEDGSRRHVELGVRGTPEAVVKAMDEMRAWVSAAGYPWEEAKR